MPPFQFIEKYMKVPTQCQYFPSNEYQYESTVTFNRSIYGRSKKLMNEAFPKIIEYIGNLLPMSQELIVVCEYHKDGLPHLHTVIASDEEIPPNKRKQYITVMNLNFGNTTCSPVIDDTAYQDYVNKHLEENYKKNLNRHYWIFERGEDGKKEPVKFFP